MKTLLLTLLLTQFQPLPEEHRTQLLEAFHLAEELGPQVWPGFRLSDPPVLLVVGETEYLLNRREAPEGFTPVEAEPWRGYPIFARPRQLSPKLAASFPVLGDGADAVVVGTPQQTERSAAEWTLMVTHELFHTFQGSKGLHHKVDSLHIGPPEDPSWRLGFPFPYDEPDIENALHLLGYSL